MREVLADRGIVGSSRRGIGRSVSGCKFIMSRASGVFALTVKSKMVCNSGRVKGGLFVSGNESDPFVLVRELRLD